MKPTFAHVATSALLFLGAVQAHMKMASPVPYGPSPNNSPLMPDGSDFPCKQGNNPQYIVETENEITIGEPQTLSFIGSAVHGGGSCQVSLTTDRKPTKDSKWMVIKSIEGGCPSNVTGNLPEDANGRGAAVFEYTVPEGISPGKYTIAWSWINKVGNREFYMNCGPATISSPKKRRYVPSGVSLVRKQTTFPDLYVANLASVNDNTTPEGYDYDYPNPGDEVQSAGKGPYTKLAGVGGGGSAPATPTADSSSAAATEAPSQTSDRPSQSQGGVFATSAAPVVTESPAAPAAPSAAPASPEPASPAASAPAPPANEPGPSAPAATAESPVPAASAAVAGQQTPGAPCPAEGTWVCLGNAFQRCASGTWSSVIALAAGTDCNAESNGQTFRIVATPQPSGAAKKLRRAVQW